MGEKPFNTVLFHGLVRDEQGRKMSKSLGNGIDPLEVIDQYGADALRLMLVTGNAPGNDMRFSPAKVENCRNFANKVWNASRFILMNMGQEQISDEMPAALESTDKWILSKLNALVGDMTENMEKYEMGIAVSKVYDFIWDEFCDWYIEMVKPRLYSDQGGESRKAALWTLRYVLCDALRLLHPFMPFITEEIFTKVQSAEESIMISSWPVVRDELAFEKEYSETELIKEAVRGIRTVRTDMNVPVSKKTTVFVVSQDEALRNVFDKNGILFPHLAHASDVKIKENRDGIADDAVSVMLKDVALYLPLDELVDLKAEKERLLKEEERLKKEVARAEGMLKNERFLAKAPESKVKEEKEKLEKYATMLENVRERLTQLG